MVTRTVARAIRRAVGRTPGSGEEGPQGAFSEPRESLSRRVSRQAGRIAVDSFFRGAAELGRRHPHADPRRHGVEVIRDIAYADTGNPDHRLDVYRPVGGGEPRPVVIYIHGGGFRILSKDTHWVFGLAYARRGYTVFNVSYRLAPRHRYPAAIRDVLLAYQWVVDNAEKWGGDPRRLVIAGESAGANLATATTIAATFERPEPWARDVFDRGVVPKAVVAACGLLQVSDILRFGKTRKLSTFLTDRLTECSEAYLGPGGAGCRDVPGSAELDLADPLLVIESEIASVRPLPPFFVPVGTRDVLEDDTRRLAAALRGRNVLCRDEYYPGGVHAFHAFVFGKAARRCWRDTFEFLDGALPGPPPRR